MSMSFCLEREGSACASRVRFYRISPSPETPSARIVPDTIARYPEISANFQAIHQGPVFLPVLAIAEIEFEMMLSSASNEEQKRALRHFFAQYPHHLPIDDNTIEPYAMLRAQLWREYGTRKRRRYKEKVPETLVER